MIKKTPLARGGGSGKTMVGPLPTTTTTTVVVTVTPRDGGKQANRNHPKPVVCPANRRTADDSGQQTA
ncbi:hypothetical protein AND_008223 [Anopheles darlingi]|uniref:Uncharacterized protein n=1 Tax=Anopheles darlingi TaxID=43151 RepID=W5JBP2_ANODA|nr:hypothetical protein AND_008223 [Anopheles darlingi]